LRSCGSVDSSKVCDGLNISNQMLVLHQREDESARANSTVQLLCLCTVDHANYRRARAERSNSMYLLYASSTRRGSNIGPLL
jgi:hypothetical protein